MHIDTKLYRKSTKNKNKRTSLWYFLPSQKSLFNNTSCTNQSPVIAAMTTDFFDSC
jgi:hypothetical protein